jgi:hypothetical protein
MVPPFNVLRKGKLAPAGMNRSARAYDYAPIRMNSEAPKRPCTCSIGEVVGAGVGVGAGDRPGQRPS